MHQLYMIIGLLACSQVGLADQVKLTKLKVPTAKKVYVPKSLTVDGVTIKLSEKEKFKDAHLGGMAGYEFTEQPAIRVTYYIYPMSRAQISAEHLLPYEFFQLQQEISQVYANDGYQVAGLETDIIEVDGHEVLYHKHTFQNMDSSLISESYLTNQQLHFAKLRITFPSQLAPQWQPITRDLATELIRHTEVTEDKDSKIAVQINTIEDDDALNGLALSNQLIYALGLMSELTDSDMLLSFADVKSTLEKVVALEEKLAAEKDDGSQAPRPDLLTVGDIQAAGWLNEFIWSALHQPHWQAPEDLDAAAYDEWMEQQTDRILVPFTHDQLLLIHYDD